jgi:hypothetical protein
VEMDVKWGRSKNCFQTHDKIERTGNRSDKA